LDCAIILIEANPKFLVKHSDLSLPLFLSHVLVELVLVSVVKLIIVAAGLLIVS